MNLKELEEEVKLALASLIAETPCLYHKGSDELAAANVLKTSLYLVEIIKRWRSPGMTKEKARVKALKAVQRLLREGEVKSVEALLDEAEALAGGAAPGVEQPTPGEAAEGEVRESPEGGKPRPSEAEVLQPGAAGAAEGEAQGEWQKEVYESWLTVKQEEGTGRQIETRLAFGQTKGTLKVSDREVEWCSLDGNFSFASNDWPSFMKNLAKGLRRMEEHYEQPESKETPTL